jgi:hypothetical protein
VAVPRPAPPAANATEAQAGYDELSVADDGRKEAKERAEKLLETVYELYRPPHVVSDDADRHPGEEVPEQPRPQVVRGKKILAP